MVFTTTEFTFMFFPIAIILWAIGKVINNIGKVKKTRIADIILVILSIAFFGWGSFATIWWLIALIGFVYISGLLICRLRIVHDGKISRIILVVSIVILIAFLGYYKYRGFCIGIVNNLFMTNIVVKSVATPLGISFITFTAISYLADVYLNVAETGSLLDCALYISFFPKLVSGPIVLWRDFKPQINSRCLNRDRIYEGLQRICVGFGKKLILADTFGSVITLIDSNYLSLGIDCPTAWLAVILYWLQLYYDFSGYSDIAIGLADIFGFKFSENFHFPYVSCSIAEFWRRWHISLGTWFRQYVYFPLGGSRKGKCRTVLNLSIVFLLTGIWHGAGFNYFLWGAINGLFVVFDHLVKDNRIWKRVPNLFKWIGTVIISVAFWEFFRFSSVVTDFSA